MAGAISKPLIGSAFNSLLTPKLVNLKGDQLDSMTSVIVNSGYACAFYE